MKTFHIVLLGLLVSVCAIDGAKAQGVAAGLNVGTMGPGANLNVGLSSHVNVRVAGYLLPVSRSGDYTDDANDITLAYDADVKLGGASALLDWHPTGGGFRFSAGAFYNNNNATFSGRPTSDYKFSETKTFTAEKLGVLTGTVKYPAISPYLGIGLGNAMSRKLSVNLDLGVLYTGSPEVTLEGTGLIAPTANWAPTINEGIQSFQWYPYVALGFGYRFSGAAR